MQEFEENISNDEYLRNLEERGRRREPTLSNYETMSIEVEKPRGATMQ